MHRRRGRVAARCTLALAFALAIASGTRAAQPVEPIRLVYEAPAACPSRDDFIAAVMMRTKLVRIDDGTSAARIFDVHAESRHGRWVGSLVVRTGARRNSVRKVSGATCRAIVEALGLFTALAVDPNASSDAAPTAPPSSATRRPRPPSASPPSTSPSSSGSSASSVATSSPSSPPASSSTDSGTPSGVAGPETSRTGDAEPRISSPSSLSSRFSHPRLTFTIGSGVATATGIARLAMVSAAPFVELTRWDFVRVFAPSLRVGVRWAQTPTETTSAGAFSMRWAAVDVSACPLRIPMSSFGLRFCAFAEIGQLSVEPYGVAYPHPENDFWIAAGALGRLEVRLAGSFFFFAEAGPSVPFERHSYYFLPSNTVVAEAAPIGVRAALGAQVALF